ncbi:MAG: ATP-dependent helicase HrpB, partial [Gammaproteobacteria bacterium]
MAELPALPVSEVVPKLRQALSDGDEAVLEAPPGAGKTTLVPLTLLDLPALAGQKILLLEPRRVAAKSAAARLAQLLGEPLGKTVGYRMRLERKVSAATRLEVITEGVLSRQLQADPALSGVGLVIFDEFHERSLEADLGLALCLQSRDIFRDQPLKLLVMSATLDGEAVAELLGGAPLIRSKGRAYPVAVHWQASTDTVMPRIDALAEQVGTAVLDVTASHEGNVLVFLPGRAEIQRTYQYLEARLGAGYRLCTMHGSLSLDEQQIAIAPPPVGTRKIVLATNIAETSLTIEGIHTVVDSGWQREAQFDSARGVTRLHTRRISKASATQRAGRAGRLGPGQCYRLWSEQGHHSFAPNARPDILQADLSALALQLLSWGIDDPAELQWLDPPSPGAFNKALASLETLNAAHKQSSGVWALTAHGQLLAQLSAAPRLAHLLVLGARWGCEEQAAQLAALLQQGQPRGGQAVDLSASLASLSGAKTGSEKLGNWRASVLKQARQWLAQLRRLNLATQAHGGISNAILLAATYPERIAKRLDRQSGEYQLASGRRALLKDAGALAEAPFLAVAALGGRERGSTDRIFEALPLPESVFDGVLGYLLNSRDGAVFDASAGKVKGFSERCVGSIVLSATPNVRVKAEQAAQALLAAIKSSSLTLLPWTDQIRQWQARVMLLREVFAGEDTPWPDVSDEGLLATLEDWLLPALQGKSDCKDLPLA